MLCRYGRLLYCDLHFDDTVKSFTHYSSGLSINNIIKLSRLKFLRHLKNLLMTKYFKIVWLS